MNAHDEFIPSQSHFTIKPKPLFTERVTKKQLQYLLLHRPTVTVRGNVYHWGFRHVGVGIYDLFVDYEAKP